MPMSMREVLHAPRALSKRQIEALQHWLPVIGAEALMLAAFLAWVWHRGVMLHGSASVYAWVVYGLIALGLLYLWIVSGDGKRRRIGERLQ